MQTHLRSLLLLFGIVLLAPTLKAEDMDLAIEAITSIDPDRSSALLSWVNILLLCLLLLTVTAAFFSNPDRALKVQELFLPINIKNLKDESASKSNSVPLPENSEIPAHLRDLSARRATLVMSRPVVKGQRVQIDLSLLPGFVSGLKHSVEGQEQSSADSDWKITGEVKGCWPQTGEESSYMAGIKFVDMPKVSQDLLEKYLLELKSGAPSRPHSTELKV